MCSVVEIVRGYGALVFFHAQSSPAASCTSICDWLGRAEEVGEEERMKWDERRSFWLWSGVTWLWQHSSLSTAEACHSCWCPAVLNHTWIISHTHAMAHTIMHACSVTHTCTLTQNVRKQMPCLCSALCTHCDHSVADRTQAKPKAMWTNPRCQDNLPEVFPRTSWIMEHLYYKKVLVCWGRG